MPSIKAPFTRRAIEALERWQRWGSAPYRCPAHGAKLIAEADGLRCPEAGCGHRREAVEDFILKVRYCTKERPCPADAPPSEYWIHVDAIETDPDCDGPRIPFHCPNCGRDFTVEI